ncbi:MAG TPA: SigB/SigF/SigG family RNA polymerase sigma factor [Acidimicrobiales bacterium]|nr:SigB/SigF/SigG family RNA polymerase sigma factor [Acidimicrobiales bacterium]
MDRAHRPRATLLPAQDDTRAARRPHRLQSVATASDRAAARGSDDAPEVTARFLAYRESGDRSIRNELVEHHRSLADALARRYAERGEPLDDLVQVALLGLVKAVGRFDPDKGIPFAGFAVPTITGELRRHFRDHTWAVKVHRRAKDLHVRIPAVSDRLTAALGRTPTPAELAEETGCSIDELIEALDAGTAYRTTSTDTVEGGLAASYALDRSAGVPSFEPEDRLQLARLLAELSERDRTIVGLRYFEDLSQSEIAERVGVSQVHVSRLLRAALGQMRSSLAEQAAG